MRYIPNSVASVRESMLESMGVKNVGDLFVGIPHNLLLTEPLKIPPAESETELIESFKKLAGVNRHPDSYASFLGAGVYDHIRPLVIDTLISRSEFYTSYTPYQPEVNQGTVHSIFEFQTMICQLTGMDVANASMYDGSTALAEGMLMASRITGRKKVVCAGALHPEYTAVLKTYAHFAGLTVETVGPGAEGIGQVSSLKLEKDVAAVIVQSPNFFGCVEDVTAFATAAHEVGALLIVSVAEAISLGILKPPAELGADIVTGEGQSFGLAPSYGGPFVGFFAARDKFQRQMPGRLIGQAFDQNGNRAFTITMATREQHIRREKATSNICTNEALCALVASIYLSTVGRRGLQEIAARNAQKAAYALEAITRVPGYSRTFATPVFNEFVITTPAPAETVVNSLLEQNLLAGLPLAKYYPERTHELLVCVTENTTRAAIDALAAALATVKHED
ncbi:MAG: aminomethyl-transferring glycine dehydrogenase subunit GcvPA [Blastocatellia bacterium]|nr:aminomethyl-transferring glycine dehydrogenase subunit GcvPA [Blastocatellia bacterium]